MDVIKKAYDLIRKQNRMDEEKRAYADVMNSKKKRARRKQAEKCLISWLASFIKWMES